MANTKTIDESENRVPKKGGFIRTAVKTLLWVLLIVFILLLLALATVWFLAGTDKGFDLALSQATQRVEGLEIETPKGNLNTGIDAKNMRYRNDNVAIDINGIDTDWQTTCLVQKKFCFDRMVIDRVRVESLVKPAPSTNEKRTTAIELPTFKLPLDVNIDDVRINEFIFKPYGDAPEQVLTDINLQAENTGNDVIIKSLSARYKNFTAIANGNISLEGDYPLDLTINAKGTDLIEEHDITLSLNATNSIENLSFNGTVVGAVNATLNGTVKALEPTLPLTLQLRTDEAGWPLDTHEIAKATGLSLNVNGDLNDFNVALNTDVSGEKIPNSTITMDAIANPSRVLVPNIIVQTLEGFATGNAGVALGEQISWVTQLIIKDINPQSVLPEGQKELKGDLNGIVRANGGVHDGKWMLNLTQGDLNGEMRGIPFMVSAKVSKSYEELWSVSKLVLDNGDNRINAKGTVGNTLDIDADIKLTQLQNFLPGLAGGFEADLRITGKPTLPNVDLNAQSTVLKYQDILITGLNIDADVDKNFDAPSSVKLTIDRVQKDRTPILNTRLELDGKRDEHSIKFFADGPDATALNLNAAGALTQSFDWLGEMRTALIELPAHKVSLAKPFDLGWKNDIKKASIGEHCWKTEQTRLCLKNEVLAEPTGTATIALTRYPLARLDPFLPAGSELQGQLKADATVLWGKEHPGGYNATLVAKVDDGGVKVVDDAFDELSFTYDTFTLDGKANGEKINANVMLDSDALGKADANITMDPTKEQKPINGDLTLNGFDISFLKAFFPQFDEVGGEINTNGKISGNLTDPRFNGQVVLEKPIVQAESLPVNIDGGRITARVDGKRANIRGAVKSGEGKVNVSGTADWNKIDAWKADILLEAQTLNIQSDPLVQSEVDANIRINAKPSSIGVSGDVNIPMARIEVEEIAQGATSLSSDVIIVEDEEEKAKEDQAASALQATKVNVNVNVSLGDDVRLEAFGLQAQLKGDMSVGVQPPRPPELSGEVRIVEGIFKQYGQDLTVTDGQVLFVGPLDQTRLNMDAVRTIDGEDRVAGLRVAGQLSEPEVTLFTEPADKAQDAILSYIVLGRDINDTSDSEQNLLATAAIALTLKGSRGTATEFAESLGIRDFALDARGRGDETEVVVSGKLSDNLLIRYGQSVFSSTNTLYLRYDITRQLYLEAASGVSKAVDLVYSFSF